MNKLTRKIGLFSIFFITFFAGTNVRGVELIPQPKNVTWSNVFFILNNKMVIVSEKENRVAAQDLQRELKEVCGITCPIVSPREYTGKRKLLLETGGLGPEDSKNREGYTLLVGKDAIVIRSKAAPGVFYGVQTLKQLFQRRGNNIVALGCEIRDEPAMAMRGELMSFRRKQKVTPETLELIKREIDAFAYLKINTLMWEFADCMLYDSQSFPKKEKYAFTKKEVKELVSYAKARHFEVIPYLQMHTHVLWMMSNPENAVLLEDPTRTGWGNNWCPSNPAVEDFIKDILDETIEVFQPRYFNVNLDEMNHGPFGTCERCSKVEDKSQLFLKSIMLQYNLLTPRGIKIMVAHDSLLPPDGVRTRPDDPAQGWTIVDQIPKDVIIWHWDYLQFGEKSKSHLEYFTKKGFPFVGVTFNYPQNIEIFSNVIAQNSQSLGMVGTHWYRVRNGWTDLKAISPMVWSSITLHALYAWNPMHPPLKDITYDTVYATSRLLHPKESLVDTPTWEPLGLDRVFNERISDNKDSWPGRGTENSLSRVFDTDIINGDVTFRMANKKKSDNVILLTGSNKDGLPPGPVVIPVQRKTKCIAFLHSCYIPYNNVTLTSNYGRACEKPPVGKYRINYDDGTSVEIDLLYGWNIVDWNNKLGVFDGRIAYDGETEAGSRIELIRMDWVNPMPEKVVKSITVSTAADEGKSLALFAISTMK